MGKYLKVFDLTSEYQAYVSGPNLILPNVSHCKDDNTKVYYHPYVVLPHDYSNDYFTMVVTAGGNITWSGVSNNALSYSIDDGSTWSTASSSITLPVNEGNKVLWKGTPTPQTSFPNYGIGKFNGANNVRYSIEGNVMSLLFGDNFKGQTSLENKNHALNGLFSNNANITNADNMVLPATTLTNSCYEEMFHNCTSLTTAPELPATTLANRCYSYMFQSCTSLTIAPELPATTLADSCYNQMFDGCTSLTTAPELPATTLAEKCYIQMFHRCTSLTTAPDLPATTLVNSCYYSMFSNTNVLPDCTNIDFSNQSIVASGGLKGLFTGTKITDAQLDVILKEHGINNYSLPVTTLANDCYQFMFSDCTNLTTAPELPATTLADKCYLYMFNGCINLKSIKCLATNISASRCTENWVNGVASKGTFTKAASISSWTRDNNGIPNGWTVVNAA